MGEIDGARSELLELVDSDRLLAHRLIFAHTNEDGDFHKEIIRDVHGNAPRVLIEAFRGGAKSTKIEEAIAIRVGLQEFKFPIIVSENYAMACLRLKAIKRTIEKNDRFRGVFGDLRGPTWNDGVIELSTGQVIMALGRGQSFRGIKELTRPDYVLVDDLEDRESTRDSRSIEETMSWLMTELIPALEDPINTPVQVVGTPLVPGSMIEQLRQAPDWKSRRFPIKSRDLATGGWVATWPSKFPLEAIDKLEAEYSARGKLREFNQEYMLESETDDARAFKKEHIRYNARVRTWETINCMIDPARTTKTATSAMTGVAAWSWERSNLLVWENTGGYWSPDEIINKTFELNEKYSPIWIGFEEDGLNEWAMQPFRQEQARRGITLPIEAVRAPKGKIDFIKGLQPFHKAGEILFCGQQEAFAIAETQLLAFPKGCIDAPNALAYSLRLKPGEPMFSDFSRENIFAGGADLYLRSHPVWLALNSDGHRTTACLVQNLKGSFRVLHDFAENAAPEDAAPRIVREASAVAAARIRVTVPPRHFDRWTNIGLPQAVARIPAECVAGGVRELGRAEISRLLRERTRGFPSLQVSDDARWTLNAFSGGYARKIGNGGILAKEPEPGIYSCLMEGLESLAGLSGMVENPNTEEVYYRQGRDGQPYMSALRRGR